MANKISRQNNIKLLIAKKLLGLRDYIFEELKTTFNMEKNITNRYKYIEI